MATEGRAKRAYGKPFSNDETELLVAIIGKYSVVESKKCDASTWREKAAAWKNVTDDFNSQNPVKTLRTTEQIKARYGTVIKSLKKKLGQHRADVNETGGGKTKNPAFTRAEEMLLQIFPEKADQGMYCCVDTDFGGEEDWTTASWEEQEQKFDPVNQGQLIVETEPIKEMDSPAVSTNDDCEANNKGRNNRDEECSNTPTETAKQKLKQPVSRLKRKRIGAADAIQDYYATKLSTLKEKSVLDAQLLQLEIEAKIDERRRREELHCLDVKRKKMELELLDKQLNG